MGSDARRRARRPLWPWIAGALVLAAAVALALAFALVTPERAHGFAERFLSRAAARELRFREARLSLWPPFGIDVRGLEVADPGGFARGTLLRTGRVRLDLALWPLLTGDLRLSGVRIESPQLRLAQDAQGRGNWEGLGRTGTGSREHELLLRDLEIADGSLVFLTGDGRPQLALSDLDAELAARGGEWQLSASVGRIRTASGNPKGMGPLHLEAGTERGRGGAPARLRYYVELARWTAEGTGTLAPGRLEIAGARLSREGGSARIEDLAARLEFDSTTVRLTRLSGRAGRSPFELSATLRPGPPRGVLRAHVDVADVGRLLPPGDGGQGSGRVQLAARFSAPSPRPEEIRVEGTAILAGVSWRPSDPEAHAVTGLDGRLWFSGTSASVSGMRGAYGPLPFQLSARVERPLALLSAMDVPRAAGAPVAFVRFDLATGAVDAARLFPPGKPLEAAPALAAEGVLRASRLTSGRLDARAVTAQIRYDRGLLALDGASGQAYGGALQAIGRMDFRRMEEPLYDLSVQAERLAAGPLLAAWTPFPDFLTGTVDMTVRVDGRGFDAKEALRTLTAVGVAHAVGGRLQNAEILERAARWTGLADLRAPDFRDLLWRFRVQQGRVELEETWIRTGAGDYLVGGTVGMDGALALTVSAVLPAARLAALSPTVRAAAGFFRDEEGRLLLDFAVRGTVKDPRFEWRTDRAAARLAQRLEDELLGRVQPVQAAFEDSLARARAELEARLRREAERRREEVRAAIEREQEKVQDRAAGWLSDLLKGKPLPDSSAHVPPAPAPPDSAAPADSVRPSGP